MQAKTEHANNNYHFYHITNINKKTRTLYTGFFILKKKLIISIL